MKSREDGETLRKICLTCGKPVAGGRRVGSFTAFLFGAADCACSPGGDRLKASGSPSEEPVSEDVEFCPKCGLKIVSEGRNGSLTGFLFQSTRCKCPPDEAFAGGQMSAKFWKLKQAGVGTVFVRYVSDDEKADRSGHGSIDLATGSIIGGTYKIIEFIGLGGMGEVYLARHETLGKKCALKVIPPEQVTEMGWQRFQLEARAVAKLDHINLVRVTDLGIHEGCLPFYAMDYVEGKNLADLLAEHGPMPLSAALDIFMQVCDGVDCAHRGGILHRDLKPANIMVQKTKTGQSLAKVLDFGLAKLTKQDRFKQSLTAVGDVFGSPFYMSPEQCNGEKLDRRSDIYSIGCTMFECLTGRTPFVGGLTTAIIFSHLEADPPSLESIVGEGRFPDSMEIVIAKLLRKNPVERYQTLLELKTDLALVAAGKDVQPLYVSRAKNTGAAGVESAAPASSRRQLVKSSNTSLLLVLSALVVMFLAGGALFINHQYRAPVQAKPQKKEFTDDDPLAVETNIVGLSGGDYTDKEIEDFERYNLFQAQTDEIRVEKEFAPYLDTSLKNHSHFLNSERTILNFPDKFSIGAISFDDHKPILAAGTIAVPAGEEICFYQHHCLRSFPSFLDMFGPDDLTGLELIIQKPAEAISKIKTWKRLKKLSFFNSLVKSTPGFDSFDQSYLKDQDLPALEELKNLESLGLCGQGVSGAKVADLALTRRVSSLRIKSIYDIGPVLKILPGLDNIKELWLISQTTTDKQLEYMVKMKNLESLRIRRSALTPESLQFFRRMPSLKHLYLDRNWSASTKAQFKEALPFVEFEAGLDRFYWTVLPGEE